MVLVMSQSEGSEIDKNLVAGLKLPRTSVFRVVWRSALISILLILLGVLVWQGITASGNPPAPNDTAADNLLAQAAAADTIAAVTPEPATLLLLALGSLAALTLRPRRRS